jgi:hypothetical protein
MSLDVYVLPLWQFKSGSVQTAAQRVFSPRSVFNAVLGSLSPSRTQARKRGRELASKLVAEAEGILKIKLAWQDQGRVVLAEQASWGFQALRAYAKWLDLTDLFPTFPQPPENNFYKHPAMLWNDGQREFRFSHIIEHSLYNGYYLPCRFERIIQIQPFETLGGRVFYHSLGSTYLLAHQLELMRPLLPSKLDVSETAHDLIHSGFDLLKRASEKSIEHKLPIIFWG